MKWRARQTIYWPGLSNDIVAFVDSFQVCQELQPSQQQEPLLRDALPERVFEEVSADLFESRRLHVLVYTDRLSGWPVIHRWYHASSARELIQAITENLVVLGVPIRIRTDGGPQFGAGAFQQALQKWGVVWENSSPYYAQSNGHAEAEVNAMKRLVLKIAPAGDLTSDAFMQGLLEFRNTQRENGMYPAEMVFGSQLLSILPAHRTSFATRWKDTMNARDRQHTLDDEVKKRYDERASPLSPLPIGSHVRIQDPHSLLWERTGQIVSIGKYRSYRIKFASGSVLWRNRRHLRPLLSDDKDAQKIPGIEGDATTPPANSNDDGVPETAASQTRPEPASIPTQPRRSGRIRRPRLMVDV
jgi:transposase InsO family protein